jgi:3-oxoacyl-[acyl-carrier protein] reductase
MDLGLGGKCAIVAGASRGIGRSLARRLADEGASVAICARRESALRETERNLGLRGVKVPAACCDAADRDDLDRFLEGAHRPLAVPTPPAYSARSASLGEMRRARRTGK